MTLAVLVVLPVVYYAGLTYSASRSVIDYGTRLIFPGTPFIFLLAGAAVLFLLLPGIPWRRWRVCRCNSPPVARRLHRHPTEPQTALEADVGGSLRSPAAR